VGGGWRQRRETTNQDGTVRMDDRRKENDQGRCQRRERRENETGAKNRNRTRPKDRNQTGAENGSDRNQPESVTSNGRISRKQRGEGEEQQEKERGLGEREDGGSGEQRGDGDQGGSKRGREKEGLSKEREEERKKPTGEQPARQEVDILSLNAQSVVKKLDELACVANTEKPDLILITETWCNEDITNAFLSIDGYELQMDLRMDRGDTAGGRGGGLLVYAKEGGQVLKDDKQVSIHQSCNFTINDISLSLIYRSHKCPP
jgi:hypothetical protein